MSRPPAVARVGVAAGVAAALALTWLALGPLGLLALAALALRRRRRGRGALRPERPWAAVGAAALVVALLAGLLVIWPERWLVALPGPGRLVTSAYDGRPAAERPLPGPTRTAGRPDLPVAHAGPLGDLPRTARASLGWPGRRACAPVAQDLRPPVLLCAAADRTVADDRLVLLAAGAPEPVSTLALGPGAGLDAACRPVAAVGPGGDVRVSDGRVLLTVPVGGAEMQVARRTRLPARVADGGCAAALLVDRSGRAHLQSRSGRLAVVAASGTPAVGPPGAGGAGGLLAAGATAFVAHGGEVTAHDTTRRGLPRRWRRSLGGALGPPALVGGRWLAIGVDDGPRAAVAVLDAATGEVACRVTVFEDGAGRTTDRPTTVPGGVLVRNAHPGAGDDDGLALLRVPTVDGGDRRCEVAWTAGDPVEVPVTVSAPTGLAYVVRTAWSPWLVPATRLSALDVRTGREAFTTRVATGLLGAPTGAAPAVGPGGAAYVVTRGGLVRVADR